MEVKFTLPNGITYNSENSHVLILLPELLEDNINKIINYYQSIPKNIDFDLKDILEKVKVLSINPNITIAYDLNEQSFIMVKTYEFIRNSNVKNK